MTASRVDVLVVGGGPSGSLLASLLAREGVGVRIVDKTRFPRSKACGDCVNPGAVRVLERNGLLEVVLRCEPAPIHGWQLSTVEGETAIAMLPSAQRGLGLNREQLDDSLLRQATLRGVELHEGSRVVGLEPASGGMVVFVRGPNGDVSTTRASVLVGADGLRSTVARRLRMVARLPRLRKLSLTCRFEGQGPDRRFGALHLGRNVTVGLAPLHATNPLWNGTVVVNGVNKAKRPIDPTSLFRSMFAQAPFGWSEPLTIVSGPWASGPFDWPTRSAVADHVMLVGDAAGYYDPLTGQGIYRSLRSAELAAEVLVDALRRGSTRSVNLMTYHKTLRQEMRVDAWVQRAIETALARSLTRRTAIKVLGALPPLADGLAAVTGNVVRTSMAQSNPAGGVLAWRQRT